MQQQRPVSHPKTLGTFLQCIHHEFFVEKKQNIRNRNLMVSEIKNEKHIYINLINTMIKREKTITHANVLQVNINTVTVSSTLTDSKISDNI